MPSLELGELVRFADGNRVQKIELVGSGKNTKVQQLYDAILEGVFRTDEEYAQHLFGHHPRRISYLRRVERKLLKQLHHTVLFMDDQKLGNKSRVITYDCIKEFATARVLLLASSKKAGILLAERTIKKALSIAEHSDIIYLLALNLSIAYLSIPNSTRKVQHYSQMAEEFEKLLKAETLAEKYYYVLSGKQAESMSSREELIGLLVDYIQELKPSMQGRVSRSLIYNFFSLQVKLKQLTLDYEGVLDTCDEALRIYINITNYPHLAYLYIFNRYKLDALTKLKRVEEGQAAVQECLKRTVPGHPFWYNTHFYTCIYYFHIGQYQQAYEYYHTAASHPSFKYLTNYGIIENLKLVGGYVHYLIEVGQVQDVHTIAEPFSVGKFINETPVYSKDKRGHNISVLVLQILFLLQRKKHGEVLDKMDALNMYCYRYLRKGHTFRSNCFFKMLLEIPKGYFNRTASTRKAQRYLDRLTNAPFKKTLEGADMEVIPYEALWELALISLDR